MSFCKSYIQKLIVSFLIQLLLKNETKIRLKQKYPLPTECHIFILGKEIKPKKITCLEKVGT